MADPILVRFAGTGSGEGDLTWGQQQIWAAMRETDTSQSLRAVMPLPPGKTPADLAGELWFFLCRYPSLRSRLRFDADGGPRQVVSASGEIALTVLDVTDGTDPAQAAEELADRWEHTTFDYTREWPIRLAAVRSHGVATHIVVVLNHLVADGGGVAVMMDDLAKWDRRSEPDESPPTGVGPLELAQRQNTPATRRHSDTALAHWGRLLRGASPHRFASLPVPDQPRYRQAAFDSPAMRLAAHIVADRTGTATPPVLLAAFAAALALTSGVHPVLTQTIVSNRFRPGLADAVHPVSQNGLLLIDIAGVTFDEAVTRAFRASVLGSKHAYYDPAACDRLREQIHLERGQAVHIGCVFNDRRQGPGRFPTGPVPTPDQVRAAVPDHSLAWGEPLPLFNEQLMMTVDDAPDSVALLVEVDTWYMAASDAETLLLTMESILVDAALDPDARTGVS